MIYLTKLYKKSAKTGSVQVCNISHGEENFFVEHGQLNGKLRTDQTECFSTNEGRSNERSPVQQARFEAIAKHASKIKSGYVTDESGESQIYLPMKIKIYHEHIDKVTFPCDVDYKYNGINGTFHDHQLAPTSRTYSDFPEIPHLNEDISSAMKKMGVSTLGVELYIHNTHLQLITSAVKATKESSKQLMAIVFELPGSNLNRIGRRKMIEQIEESEYLKIAHTERAYSHEDIQRIHDESVALGHEGVVVYNLDAMYEYNVKSNSIFKKKEALDGENRVISHKIDKNGAPVYICSCSEGKEVFSVIRKGTREQRLADAAIASSNHGKWLTIEYETLSMSGKPTKPVGLCFRDCDINGDPLV